MTNYVVTTTSDCTAGDGDISLREAITAASSNAAFGDAAAGTLNDTITFAAGISGQEIALAIGELTVAGGEPITINGDIDGDGTADISITRQAMDNVGGGDFVDVVDGAGDFRIFDNAGTLTLNDLNISNGASTTTGGAVRNSGTLTTDNVTLAENTAGTNGGAVYNTGTATFTDTTFDSNEADGEIVGEGGGGIFNAGGTVTITGGMFDSNRAAGM